MLSALWGRITGKDKRKKYPDQQAVFLGRVGDYTVVFPYGLYADLPADTLLLEIKPGVAIPVTVKRPGDTEQAEPTFFHPATNTRIIARNNGDLDILTDDTTPGDVNIQTVNANITASGDINATAGGDINATATGDANVTAANMTATISGSTIVDSPTTQFTGNVGIGGSLMVTGASALAGVTSNGTNVGDTHTHPQGNDSAGNTEQNTGAPI